MPRKVLVVGDAGVGKTSLIRVGFKKLQLNHNGKPTVGADFTLIEFENEKDNVAIWDIAGQERFGSMLPAYSKETALVLFVVDLTRNETFSIVHELNETLSKCLSQNVIKVLVANKSDLLGEDKVEIMIPAIRKFAEKENLLFSEKECITSIHNTDSLNRCVENVLGSLPVSPSKDPRAVSPRKNLVLPTEKKSEQPSNSTCAFFKRLFCCGGTTVDDREDESLTSSSSSIPRLNYGSSGYL